MTLNSPQFVIRTGLLRQDRLPPRARHHLRVLPVQYPAPNLVAHHPHQEVKARPKTVKGAEECDKEREKAGPFSPRLLLTDRSGNRTKCAITSHNEDWYSGPLSRPSPSPNSVIQSTLVIMYPLIWSLQFFMSLPFPDYLSHTMELWKSSHTNRAIHIRSPSGCLFKSTVYWGRESVDVICGWTNG